MPFCTHTKANPRHFVSKVNRVMIQGSALVGSMHHYYVRHSRKQSFSPLLLIIPFHFFPNAAFSGEVRQESVYYDMSREIPENLRPPTLRTQFWPFQQHPVSHCYNTLSLNRNFKKHNIILKNRFA